jgi:hypothetical protein
MSPLSTCPAPRATSSRRSARTTPTMWRATSPWRRV